MIRKQAPGYIYIVGANDCYKIGHSANVKLRIRQLSLPFKVEIVHTIAVSNMLQAESYLHRLLRDKRLNSEWFALTTDDLAQLQAIDSLEAQIEALPKESPTPKNHTKTIEERRQRAKEKLQERELLKAELRLARAAEQEKLLAKRVRSIKRWHKQGLSKNKMLRRLGGNRATALQLIRDVLS